MDTKPTYRHCPEMSAGESHGTVGLPLPAGSPRALARRMAIEGAARLGHLPMAPADSSFGSDLSGRDQCPLSNARRATWAIFVSRPVVAGLALFLYALALSAQVSSTSPAALI